MFHWLVYLIWVGKYVGRPDTSLGPITPFLSAVQLECTCIQQCLLERKELLVFAHTNVAGAQPVHITLPCVVLVDIFWVGGHVGQHYLFVKAFQPERVCIKQGLLERQELLAVAFTNCPRCQATARSLAIRRACRFYVGSRAC